VLVDIGDALLPLQSSFAREFAQDWIDAWNSHDLERILTHYDGDILLTSPVALKLLNGDGTVRGKAALREYFSRGVQAFPDLRFDLIDVLWGTETIVVCYFNNVRGNKTAEVMLMNSAGKIARVWANYDQ
jgi:ketosteroid isomerase-like protein